MKRRKRKFISAMLFGALLIAPATTFVGCADYDGEGRNLPSIYTVTDSRQCPDHYTIRAGRNLPDKDFRYLRTVIVTAAVYRGFNSMLPLASDISS